MKKYLLLAAAMMALAACNNDDNYVDQPVAAQITATIGESVVSRASNDKWAEDDRIGITMIESNGENRYVNMEYIIESTDGKFTGTTMYFKNKKDPVTLTAYYPFAGTEGTSPEAIVASTIAENQTSEEQPKLDFLYVKMESVMGTNPNVRFMFSHQMSKLTLIFKNGNDGTDVSKITSYQIDGLLLDGTFNTATGVCTAKSEAEAQPLTVAFTAKDGDAMSSLILFPQATDNKTVRLTISDSEGQDYACTLNFEDNRIESGNNYQFTITVNKTGLIVNALTITDWNKKESLANADAIDPE